MRTESSFTASYRLRAGYVLPALIFLSACSNLPYRIASHVNNYAYFERQYELKCKTATAPCVALKARLDACFDAVHRAQAADHGGAAKYQEQDMNAACKVGNLQ